MNIGKFLKYGVLGACLSLAGGFAHAGALTDTYENSLIDWLMRAQTLTPPTTGAYIALFTTCPTDSTGGTEVSTGSYARVNYAASLANWAGTQAAASTTASIRN